MDWYYLIYEHGTNHIRRYPCFRTMEEVEAEIDRLEAQQAPGELLKIIDIIKTQTA